MTFPRYPIYKKSGIELLGEVPKDWGVAPLKRGFFVTLGKMLQPESSGPDDRLLPYLRAANIQWGGVDTTDIKQMWFSKRDREQLRLEMGDLLVSEGGDVGRSCLWLGQIENCYFQNSVNRVRAYKGQSNRYLCYWMSTIKDKGYIDVLCNKSTIAHFTAEKVAAVPVPLPPPDEQAQIASFLDSETAKIDELVAEQRRLIDLLDEKRQAVVSYAVTKGLNPDVSRKPSGIEWLGEVPAHWDVIRLRRLAKPGTSITYGIVQAGPDIEGGVPYIRTSDMAGEVLPESGYMRTTKEIDDSYSRSKVRPNDLVVAIRASLGKGLLVPDYLEGANLTQGTARICPGERIIPRFLMWAFNSDYCQSSIQVVAKGTTFLEITLDALRRIPLALPPISEQVAIVTHIDKATAQLDTLTLGAKRGIELLQERRFALISAAVTGQIDVRGFVKSEAA